MQLVCELNMCMEKNMYDMQLVFVSVWKLGVD